MVLDTGSSVSLVDMNVIKCFPNVNIEPVSTPVLRLVNGNTIVPVGKVNLDITVENKNTTLDFLIYTNLPFTFLLGLDYCRKSTVDIDFEKLIKNSDEMNNFPFVEQNFIEEVIDNNLRVCDNHNIKKNSGKWVTVLSKSKLSSEVLMTP